MQPGDKHQNKHLKYISIVLVSSCMVFRKYPGWKVDQTETENINGRRLRTPKVKKAIYSNSEINELFTPVQLTTEPPEAPARINKSKMTTAQRNLIRAHNESPNGLKLGISKDQRKGHSNSELFRPEIQINLF